MNCDVCECVHVYYKYNITLYNLRIIKYREFVTCVYVVKKVNDVLIIWLVKQTLSIIFMYKWMWLYGSIINVMSMGLVFSFNFVEDPSGRQKAQQQGQQRFGKQVAKPSGPSGRNDGSQVHEITNGPWGGKWA